MRGRDAVVAEPAPAVEGPPIEQRAPLGRRARLGRASCGEEGDAKSCYGPLRSSPMQERKKITEESLRRHRMKPLGSGKKNGRFDRIRRMTRIGPIAPRGGRERLSGPQSFFCSIQALVRGSLDPEWRFQQNTAQGPAVTPHGAIRPIRRIRFIAGEPSVLDACRAVRS
jgi:hypothetical protein